MTRSIAILIASVLTKATPLLQSLIVLHFSGAEYYSVIGYYLITTIFLSALTANGVIPAYIKSTAKKSDECPIVQDFTRFVIVLVVSSIVLFSLLGSTGFFGNKSIIVIVLFGASVSLNSVLLPILYISGAVRFAIVLNTLFLLINMVLSYLTQFITIFVYQYIFILPSCFLSIVLAIRFFKDNKIGFSLVNKHSWSESFTAVWEQVMPVFLPNVFWMGSIYFFGHRLSESVLTSEEFSLYVLGMQIFAIFVFIPNSLGPLILSKLLELPPRKSFNQSVLQSSVFFGLSLLGYMVFMVFAGLLELLDGDQVSVRLFTLVAAAGIVAAAIGPFSNFLVRLDRALFNFFPAITWAVFAHIGLTFFAGNVGDVFFLRTYLP